MSIADLTPFSRMREQRAWYWYDWANSAYITTTAAVLFAPYLTSVAERSVGCAVGDGAPDCETNMQIVGLSVSPGSLVFYLMTLSTLLSAIVLPIVGAGADRSPNKPRLLGIYAWVGSVFAALMFFVAGTNWELGAVLLICATLCLGSSLVVYDSILIDIATPDERDRVSSRGWALGYLGGGLLLAANFGLLSIMDDTELAVRISMLSAAAWWAAFTIIPVRGIRRRPPAAEARQTSLVAGSFGQLWRTLKDLRNYPVTLTFLAAYLFFNDGIQTVIYAASVYANKQLGFSESTVLGVYLVVQFVGVAGALLFGRVAQTHGAHRTILAGLGLWILVIIAGYFAPYQNIPALFGFGVAVGLVLGGTQALSRSFFSQLIPRGREAEYYALYQACERGTSWLGTLVFGLVHQLTGSYRPALVALLGFFVIGGLLLAKVDARRGIIEAGNVPPVVV